MGTKKNRADFLIGMFVIVVVALGILVILRTVTTKDRAEAPAKSFLYELNDLRKTDPALIKYAETGRIETGFQHVFAVETDSDDRVYVAGDKAIQIFGGDGVFLSKIELTGSPGCLTVAEDGRIYVGMRDHVEVYDASGTRKARWENAGENAILTSIAVSGDNVFAANFVGRVILRYNTAGKLLNRIGEKDAERNILGFVVPSPYFDLAVAPDGLLRTTNPGLHRIEAYTFDGDLELFWGEPSMLMEGFSGCCNPVNFAIFPDGKFATCEKGLSRVKIYSAKGVFESVVAGTEAFAENVMTIGVLDVALDSRGRVLILDPCEKAVRVFVSAEELDS